MAGCGKGLCEISHGNLLNYGISEGLPEDEWNCMLLRRNGMSCGREVPQFIASLSPGHKKFEVSQPSPKVGRAM